MEEAFAKGDLPEKIAVAVSGGSDSLALCLLANDWCCQNNILMIALTVDHGLRPEAAIEANKVTAWLSGRDIPHRILKWNGPYPTSGIQSKARKARYDLMLTECASEQIDALLLGHQLEDQLETLLLRLSKGSGLSGLAAMSLISYRNKMKLVRPLLAMPRLRLRTYLKECKQDWFDDPSNENPIYTRTKLGSVLKAVSDLPGSDLQTVALASARLQRADDALDQITSDFLSDQAVISEFGFVTIEKQFFEVMPLEIAIRFLDRIFTFVRGIGEKPSLSALEKLIGDLKEKDGVKARTLSGCQFAQFHAGWIICREAGRTGLPTLVMDSNKPICWDDRFVIVDHETGETGFQNSEFEVGVMGESGWATLKEVNPGISCLKLPDIVQKNLPAIWKKDQLIAAPLFSYEFGRLGIAKDRFEMVFSPRCGLI